MRLVKGVMVKRMLAPDCKTFSPGFKGFGMDAQAVSFQLYAAWLSRNLYEQ
jgi:hypothetical protein